MQRILVSGNRGCTKRDPRGIPYLRTPRNAIPVSLSNDEEITHLPIQAPLEVRALVADCDVR